MKELVSPRLNTTSLAHVKDVHLYSVNKSWQNDICNFRAMNVVLTQGFKLISFLNIYICGVIRISF